jgi:glutamate carboxypeptidase
LELLAELVALDAPTGDGHALHASEALLVRCVDALGGSVTRHPSSTGTHVEAHFGPRGERPLLIVGHYDTVWPQGTAAERPLASDGDTIHGPGVFDMRGGLVAALAAIELLTELGELHRPVRLLITADEESGSLTSRDLIVALGRRSEAVLIPEPPLPGGLLKTRRKGVLAYRLDVSGRSAHAGIEPEKGVSAVHELAGLVLDLEALNSPSAGTTVNAGRIGGGTHANVVADSAFAEVDIRVSTMDEWTRIQTDLAKLKPRCEDASLRSTLVYGQPPMERTAPIAALVDKASHIAALLGISLGEGASGGASDANFLAPCGVAVLDGLGPDGGGAHAVTEHIFVSSLKERIALFAMLMSLL